MTVHLAPLCIGLRLGTRGCGGQGPARLALERREERRVADRPADLLGPAQPRVIASFSPAAIRSVRSGKRSITGALVVTPSSAARPR